MKHFIILIAAISLLFSCKKETTPSASADAPNPFARVDNPGSTVDHQIYQVFQTTGVPILYNDTVSKQPLTTLSVNYHIGGPDGAYKVRYLAADQDKLTGVQFVNNNLLTHLTGNARPFAVLITDSVITSVFSFVVFRVVDVALNSYSATNALAIGAVKQIQFMNADSLKSYTAYVLAGQLTSKLTSLSYSALLNNFNNVSNAYYAKTLNSVGKKKESYGLLTIGNESGTTFSGGTQADDFARYLRLFLMNSYTDLQNRYQTYPLVLNKLAYLQTALATLGYKP